MIKGATMQRYILLSSAAALLIALGLGLTSRGDEPDELTELIERQKSTRQLEATIEALGPQAPAAREPDGLSIALQTLENDEVSNAQLRTAVKLLAQEIVSLRRRVSELEQSTTPRIIPAN